MTLSPAAITLQRRVLSPILFRFWLLMKLPAALWCGVRATRLDAQGCACTVPYGWRSQNPFRSTYFAAQAMAAEMSTGALVLLATAHRPFSTLIVDMKATFGRKATSLATFTCDGGEAVFAAAERASASGEPQVVTLESVGRLADGTEVSRFSFTWSVKARAADGARPVR
jgi:hypothetical protein